MNLNYHPYVFKISLVLLLYCCHLPSFGQIASLQKSNKKTIKAYFDEVINTQKPNRMGAFFSQDYIWHQMDGKDIHSSSDSSHVTMLRFIFKAIPDIHYTIDNMVAEADMVAVNTTARGTGKGEFFGLAASQRKVEFKQMFFFRLAGNKIKEEWEVVDLDGLIKQLSKP
jgi:steroid delta-isomerase-like uncharacterized protein